VVFNHKPKKVIKNPSVQRPQTAKKKKQKRESKKEKLQS
jgi:hypothetical protein